MADYAAAYPKFVAAGVVIVAVSVDPPNRSAALRKDLGIAFPLLSDPSRRTITEWGLLNEHEKGGIAIPATILIDPGLKVRFSSAEQVARRVAASEMLALVRGEKSDSAPSQYILNPGLMFLRAVSNALRFGIRVRRE